MPPHKKPLTGVFSPTTLQTPKARLWYIAMLARFTSADIVTLCTPAVRAMSLTVTRTLRPHTFFLPENYATSCALRYCLQKKCWYRLCGIPQSCRYSSLHKNCRFPEPRALVLRMVKFGQSKPDAIRCNDTVDSNLMHHRYCFFVFSGIKDRPTSTPPILLRPPVESSLRLFFKKQVIVSRTFLINLLHALETQPSTHCSTRDTFEPDLVVFAFKDNSTSKVTWGMVLPFVRNSAAPPLTFCNNDFHKMLSTHSQCRGHERNVTLPLIFHDGHMAT